MKKFIKSHFDDNVATTFENTEKNEKVMIVSKDNQIINCFVCLDKIPFGNKIALKMINENENIIKNGAVIGIATKMIKLGSLIQVHNTKSMGNDVPQSIIDEVIRILDID